MAKLYYISAIAFLVASCSSTPTRIDYGAPSEKFINIKGSISTGLTYKVRVRYNTKSKVRKCRDYS